jgi:HAD superfamily hydrolase (TIGR01509 family)
MKGVIFDMDGVLVDSMPDHYQAWKTVFKEIANIDVDERSIYLLEGMRGSELVKKVLEQKRVRDYSIVDKLNKEKNEIFKKNRRSVPFVGVKELVTNLKCSKAVVSGSARKDVEAMLDEAFGKQYFDVIITADDIEEGKPDPSPFLIALQKMGLKPSEAVVVENAPLGVEAANKAGIQCIVTLNTTPLEISDFKDLISEDRIFRDTKSAASFLENWCQ